jgi:hypothetical protein
MRINHKPSETLGELLKLEMDELSTGGMIIRYGTDSLVHVFREGAVEIGKGRAPWGDGEVRRTHQGKRTQHGKPQGVVSDDQPIISLLSSFRPLLRLT